MTHYIYISAYLRIVVCCCLYFNDECMYTEETNIFTIESYRRKNRGKREKRHYLPKKRKKKEKKKLAFIQWKWFHLHAAATLVNS